MPTTCRVLTETRFCVRRVAACETCIYALSRFQMQAVHRTRSRGTRDIRTEAAGSTGLRVAGITWCPIKCPTGGSLHAVVVRHIQRQIAGTTEARTWMTTRPAA